MKKFIFVTILNLIPLFLFAQETYVSPAEIDLPRENNVERLMKAEKPAPITKTAISDSSDYGMNLDVFAPKIEVKPRFDSYNNSPTIKVEKEQIITTPITSNNYNSIIFTIILIVALFILYKLLFK